MRIIKTSKQKEAENERRNKAYLQALECPECGAETSFLSGEEKYMSEVSFDIRWISGIRTEYANGESVFVSTKTLIRRFYQLTQSNNWLRMHGYPMRRKA